jgi:hypothetical protein
MKTIILGYSDEAGASTPQLVCGPEVAPVEQINLFGRAKQLHRFPKGLKRLEFVPCEAAEVAIFISENVGDHLEAAQKAQTEAAAKLAVEKKAQQENAGKIVAAQAKVQSTAKARNELMGKLHQAEAQLRNLGNTPEDMRTKLHESAVDGAKRLIFGDPKVKVAGLKDQVAEAIAAYNGAVQELADLKATPKIKP